MDLDPASLSDVPAEKPAVAVAISAVVATVVYLAIQLVMDGSINPVETAAFVIVFTGVYAAFLYLRREIQE
ncbi:hypothetical protein Huta_2212 [Halorhabdus utahensis DSM 12940]|uniref:Uncharacterized protein n=1 Tax=Halorhabdus utahensis (strain DSM 12940 / JCM 11049 / AX-2) TaxID=519442 RepID=C7NUM2_HALUD|nr:hypothetical protein [Halorhabdus utahensis]ACV12379.1 hypothetical protein Huta_2212 [Halorhabdus utahensis DSM 12940]